MNKIDWIFWGIIALLAAILISGIFTSGCAILQSKKSKPVIPPLPIKTIIKPAVQLWYAAKASNWLVTMSILGIAGGVGLCMIRPKQGLMIIVFCSASLFMSLAVARFAFWMAVCGLLGSVGLCTVAILSVKRALVQIIKGGEILKKNDAAYGIVSAKAAFNNAQTEAQKSKSTQKIVQKIKADLKIKGEIE